MKKTILTLTITLFVATTILTGCGTSAEKVETAQEMVIEANKNLDNANDEYLADIEAYRKEAEEKSVINEKSIADFNARIEHEKKEAKADYKKRISDLEQKNTDMKKRLSDYKAQGKAQWEIFKTEFSHDMDELGKAFKDLTVKNVK